MGSAQVTRGVLIALRDKVKAMPEEEVIQRIKQLPVKGLNLDLSIEIIATKQNNNLRVLLAKQINKKYVNTAEIAACLDSRPDVTDLELSALARFSAEIHQLNLESLIDI